MTDNLLNLLDTVQFGKGNQIINKYDADGRKLSTSYVTTLKPVVVPIGNTVNSSGNSFERYGTIYNGNKEYGFDNTEDLSLLRVHNAERYVDDLGYNYYRRDHLGNNREVWRANNQTTVQRTQYYPSGLPWAYTDDGGASEQPYKFGGKEFIETHGYDSYDFHARGMYPAIMRFTTMDPMAEKYYLVSPYVYCANNPIKYVDPDGREPRIYVEKQAFGHAFVTVNNGDSAVVYTYGRYGELGKDKSSARSTTPIGEGVLIRLTGNEAKQFIKDQMLSNEAVAFDLQMVRTNLLLSILMICLMVRTKYPPPENIRIT